MIFDSAAGDMGLVWDADGYTCGMTVRGDTETGEVVVRRCDSKGRVIIYNEDVVDDIVKRKAPLTVEPLPEGFGYKSRYRRT